MQLGEEHGIVSVIPLELNIDELGGGKIRFDVNGIQLVASVFHDCGYNLERGKRTRARLSLEIGEVGVLTHQDDDSYPRRSSRLWIEAQDDDSVRFEGMINGILGVYPAENDGRREVVANFDCGIELRASIHAKKEYTLLVHDVIQGTGRLWLFESLSVA